jgi:primosomal protein N' (replication factor Y)
MPEYLELVFNIPLRQRFTYRNRADAPAEFGCRVEAMLGNRRSVGAVVAAHDEAPAGFDPAKIKTILRRVDEDPLFNQDLVELSAWMADTYFASEGECLLGMLPGGRRESDFPSSGLDEVEICDAARELSSEQGAALESIVSQPGKQHYLYGVTGSGKTEVFLAAAERCLSLGKSVIYLVPEIALTAQVTESVQRRFGNLAALLHSGLTPSQRLREWRRVLSGEARVVVGARSAVFAPVPSLGLVVIDEEHEGSYKSGSSPRYHARQVAMKRCATSKATLLMGSATPSVEAWSLMESGRFLRHELTKRLAGGAPPSVRIVPMRGEEGCLSRELVTEIRATKALGRQTILFLNRRGFSYFFHCKSCGYELTCKHCSVALTYHKERNRMVCHYCGYQTPAPSVCPTCGSLDVGYSGFGTERVEEEVARLFPDLSVARIDTDTTQKKGELERIINAFRKGEIDILLGTQMVAKGLNFPGVRLVGVVMADTALHLPDFRSAERAFSLIVQVAGRAGRFFPDGLVLVQSLKPDNPAVSLAAQGRVADFYAWELRTREMAGFPPYSRMVRFVFRSKDQAFCRETAARFAQGLMRAVGQEADGLESGGPEIEVLGPAECPVSKVAQNYRYHILARSSAFGPMHRKLSAYYGQFEAKAGVYIEVDVDPVSLL